MAKYKYEVIKGIPVIVEPTGQKDDTCKFASFSRWEYKVLDYGSLKSRFPRDMIYIDSSDRSLLTEVEDETEI